MPNHLEWTDVAVRLLLTVVAGGLIGANRGEHGRPAGLRTTILVCLAASLSMIQVNLLLTVAGKAQNSYIVMDLMRLPLGILSGMGFIGAGAILRRDNLVLGVTTAATLWFVTVMGLCFGAGELRLGLSCLFLGLLTLGPLKRIELLLKQDHQATLTVRVREGGATESEITEIALRNGYKLVSIAAVYEQDEAVREWKCVLRRRARADQFEVPAFVRELASRKSALKVEWQP